MDLPPSPEKELSPEDIPDLNVKSYYGEHIPAVQDDFGAYSYSDSSTSPETFNGGVSNLSEDSLDNQLISSGLAEESEVPIIESTNVYNDSLCDVSNSKGFIDDILVNLGSSVSRASGGPSSSTEAELDKDDESNTFSCGESRCSCDACLDSSRESLTSSPLALSDDSSFASSCDSFDYPFLQTNTEYLDTKLTLSSPETPFSIPQLFISFDGDTKKTGRVLRSEDITSPRIKSEFNAECVVNLSCRLNHSRSTSCPHLNKYASSSAYVSLPRMRSKSVDSFFQSEKKICKPPTSGSMKLLKDSTPLIMVHDNESDNVDMNSVKQNKDITEPLPLSRSPVKELRVVVERIDMTKYLQFSDTLSSDNLAQDTSVEEQRKKQNNVSSGTSMDCSKENTDVEATRTSDDMDHTSGKIELELEVNTLQNKILSSSQVDITNRTDSSALCEEDVSKDGVQDHEHYREVNTLQNEIPSSSQVDITNRCDSNALGEEDLSNDGVQDHEHYREVNTLQNEFLSSSQFDINKRTNLNALNEEGVSNDGAQDHEPGSRGETNSNNLQVFGNSHSTDLGSRPVLTNDDSNHLRTDSAHPSRSRPASPSLSGNLGRSVPVVKLERLTLNNVRKIMRSNGVRVSSVPSYFLHLRAGLTFLKRIANSKKYYIELIDEGPILKVISRFNTLEMFFIDTKNGEIRHPHFNVDSCQCPFSRRPRLHCLRGWKFLEEEINREQEKTSTPSPPKSNRGKSVYRHPESKVHSSVHQKVYDRTSYKIENPVQHPSTSKMALKLGKQMVTNEDPRFVGKHLPSSNSSKLTIKKTRELLHGTKDNKPSKVNISAEKHIGTARRATVPPQESSPSYMYHQTTSTTPDTVPSRIPSSPTPVTSEVSQPSASEPADALEIDIFSVKGMIKQRKGSASNIRDYDSLSFGGLSEDMETRNFETEECIVADSLMSPWQCVEPSVLSDDVDYFPMFNYNEFMRQRLEDVDKISDNSQNVLVSNYLEKQAERSSKEKAVQREIERTLKSDKRKQDNPESSGYKRPRFERGRVNQDNISPVTRPQLIDSRSVAENVRSMLGSHSGESVTQPQSTGGRIIGSKRVQKRPAKRLSRPRVELLKMRQDDYLRDKKMQSSNQPQERRPGFRSLSLTKLIGVSVNQDPPIIETTVTLQMVQGVQGNDNRLLSVVTESVSGHRNPPVTVSHTETTQPLHQVWVRKKPAEERATILTSLKRIEQDQPLFKVSSTASSSFKTDQELRKSTCAVHGGESAGAAEGSSGYGRLITRHNWTQFFSSLVYDPSSVDRESVSGSEMETDDEDNDDNDSRPDSPTSVASDI